MKYFLLIFSFFFYGCSYSSIEQSYSLIKETVKEVVPLSVREQYQTKELDSLLRTSYTLVKPKE